MWNTEWKTCSNSKTVTGSFQCWNLGSVPDVRDSRRCGPFFQLWILHILFHNALQCSILTALDTEVKITSLHFITLRIPATFSFLSMSYVRLWDCGVFLFQVGNFHTFYLHGFSNMCIYWNKIDLNYASPPSCLKCFDCSHALPLLFYKMRAFSAHFISPKHLSNLTNVYILMMRWVSSSKKPQELWKCYFSWDCQTKGKNFPGPIFGGIVGNLKWQTASWDGRSRG